MLLPTALVLVCLPGAAVEVHSPSSPTVPLDTRSYVQELDWWSAAVKRLKEHPGEAARLEVALPRLWSVNVSGQAYEVPADWLHAALHSIEKDPGSAPTRSAAIETRLEAMRAEAQAIEQSPPRDAASARAKLAEILSRREFRGVHGPTWLDRLRERLARWWLNALANLINRLRGHPGAARTTLWVLAISLALAFLAWMARVMLYRSARPAPEAPGAAPSIRTWQGLGQEALARAAQGDYREAVRLAYWAGIFCLAELGVWQSDRTRTHREYLRLLPPTHPQRGALSAMTQRFERVWYAGQAASPEDFQSTLTELEKLGCLLLSIPVTARS